MGNVKANMKKIIKLMLKSKIFVIIVLIIFLLVILLPASYYFITIDSGIWDDDEKGKPSSYTQNVQLPSSSSSEKGLVIDKDAMIKEALTNIGYTEEDMANMTDEEIIEKLGINKKLSKNPKVTSLDEVTQAEILWCLTDVYSKYLNKPEELEKLLNAEIITQYPKMCNEEVELDGIIQFERHTTDGKSSMLDYIDLETFNDYISNNNTEVEKYFTMDESGQVLIGVTSTSTETLTTNDSEMNIEEYTSTLTEENKNDSGVYSKSTTNVTQKAIPYKNVVEKYTMPFQYLWALLVVSEDKNFVLELADLVEDSEIVISIFDNVTETNKEDIYTYHKKNKTDVYATVQQEKDYGVPGYPNKRYWTTEDSEDAKEGNYDPNYVAEEVEDETDYQVTYTKYTQSNVPQIELTRANVWIVDYTNEFTYQRPESDGGSSSETAYDDTEYKKISFDTSTQNTDLLENEKAKSLAAEAKEYIENNGNVEEDEDSSNNTVTKPNKNTTIIPGATISSRAGISTQSKLKIADNETTTDDDETEVIVNVSYVKCTYYTRTINKKLNSTTTTTKQKYVAGTPVNNPKVEKDTDEVNFVTILCGSKHIKAKKLITSEITSWLFEILRANDDTKEMVDLTKYLINKVLGRDKFDVDFDFSEYEPGSFTSVTTSGEISLTTTMFTKEVFIEALTAFSNKGAYGNKTNFDKNFLPRLGDIYDICVDNGFNPELAITLALKESGFDDKGTSNFWGLGTPNGSSLAGYDSFEAALKKLCDVWGNKYVEGGSLATMINQRAAERQAADCNPNGYGSAGTLRGAISVYSDLCGSYTKHMEGNSGIGGNYYLKVIYGDEFDEKCGNVHKIGVDDYTIQEKADYSAWLFENQIDYWYAMFGDYGTLEGAGVAGNFVRYYQSDSKWGNNPYNYKDGGTIAGGGCGACALAMAVTGLTGESITPDIIAEYLNNNGITTYENGAGSSKLVADKYGLSYNQISRTDKNAIDEALDQGKCLIFSISQNWKYTGSGHYIMCYKKDESGYYVLESGKWYDENTPYTFDQVFTPGNQGVFVLGK